MIMVYLEIPSQYYSTDTKKNKEAPPSEYPVQRPGMESGIYEMQGRLLFTQTEMLSFASCFYVHNPCFTAIS
jgi:hypothetical protein